MASANGWLYIRAILPAVQYWTVLVEFPH
jgi:hypothetical protein